MIYKYTCEYCGKKNEKNLAPSKKQRFCNRKCSANKKSIEHRRKLSIALIGNKNQPQKHSDETKLKISKANKGRKHSIESRRNNALAQIGKKLSEKHKKKISDTMKGRTYSYEHCKNISIGQIKGITNGSIKINHRGYGGTHISTITDKIEQYDSSYELERMKFLDSEQTVLWWTKKHGIRISYFLSNGSSHHYVPDFLVETSERIFVLEEVKGYVRNEEKFEAKCKAAYKFCKNRGWIYKILFKKDLNTNPLNSTNELMVGE